MMSARSTEYLDFSGWAERPEPTPAATGELRCDVVIVGGGYSGMSAALRLAEHGADVVLLDAEFCGWGASSRNAGHLTPTIAGDPLLVATLYRRRAPELVRLAEHAVQFVESMLDRLGIDAAYEATGNVSAALTDGAMRRSEKVAAFLARAGADVELVEGREFGLPGTFRGGILERRGGVLDPGRFAMGLRERVLGASGVRVFERSPAVDVRRVGAKFHVSTPTAQVRAGRALLATNAFTKGLPFAPRRAVKPLWVTVAETGPVDPEAVDQVGWTSRAGIYTQHLLLESYRLTARGTIAVSTRRVETVRPPLVARVPAEATAAELERGFAERFPSLAGAAGANLRRVWGGWVAMTPSWLPVAGTTEDGLHYAVSCNGHGLAQAPYVGHLLADHLAGAPRHADLDVIWRRRPRYLPAPLFTRPALDFAWRVDRVADRLARRGG